MKSTLAFLTFLALAGSARAEDLETLRARSRIEQDTEREVRFQTFHDKIDPPRVNQAVRDAQEDALHGRPFAVEGAASRARDDQRRADQLAADQENHRARFNGSEYSESASEAETEAEADDAVEELQAAVEARGAAEAERAEQKARAEVARSQQGALMKRAQQIKERQEQGQALDAWRLTLKAAMQRNPISAKRLNQVFTELKVMPTTGRPEDANKRAALQTEMRGLFEQLLPDYNPHVSVAALSELRRRKKQ